MKQSTFSVVMANSIQNLWQRYSQSLRLLLVMLLTLTASTVWGADVTVKWTASSGGLGSGIGSGTIKTGAFSWDYTRTLKSGSSYTGWTSNCIQLGKNGGIENITFTTSAIPGTIKSVSVECSSYNNAHKVSIKVGNNTYLSSTATAKWTTVSTKTGSGTSSGQIVISFTDGSRALYIKSISVTYEEAATCTTNPTVSAGSHSNLTSTTATVSCSGGITSLGSAGCFITSYGFVYGTTANPTISNTKVQVGTTYTTTGTSFSKGLTGLTANTTYYVRPYATNGNGTAYGTQTSFTTSELPKYTVTWNVNGEVYEMTQVTEGSKPTFPTTPSNCDATSTTFYGWATAAWDGKINDTNGKTIYTSDNEMPAVNGAVTYYAVFAKETTTGGGGGTAAPGSVTMKYSGTTTTNMTTGNNAATVGLDANEWSVIPTQGSASNMPGLNKDGDIRLYGHASGGNYLTISSANYTITSITVTYTGNSYENGAVSVNGSNVTGSNGTYAINANSFVIKNANTSTTQVRIKTLVINYTSTSGGGGSTTTYSDYLTTCATTPTPTTNITLNSGLSCVTNGSATVELNATKLTTFTPATRTGFTCSGYWSAPSGGVQVLDADGDFAATDVQDFITDGKWTCEGDVTLTPHWECSNTMTLSVGEQSGGTYSLSKTELPTCDCTDGVRQVTITATPNSGYSVTDISYSGNGTATKVSGPTKNGENTEWVYKFNQGDKGTGTFTVTFTAIPTYTVTWMVNDVQYGEQQVGIEGTKINKPTDPEEGICYGKVFVGWTKETIDSEGDTPPSNYYDKDADFGNIAAGDVTYYAVFATQDGATETEWVKKEIGDIKGTDVVVITMTNEGITYALSGANGSSSAPGVVTIDIDGDKLSSKIADAIKWNISNNGGNLTIYPNGSTTTWLYCTAANNGVRVGTNGNKTFTIDSSTGYLKNTATSRYLGVYNNQDWRCYTSTSTNIGGQTLGFYVKSSVGGSYSGYVTHCEVCTVTELAITPSAHEVNLGEAGNAVVTFTPTGGNGGAVSYVASPSTGVTWNNSVATFTKVGTYTITASQDMNGDKCPTEATTSVVVTATPVLYFREEPADPIVFGEVECGGNTTKANKKSVSLQGYNLTGSVKVTVQGDYKIAKIATEDIANYTKSLTLEKTDKGKIDSSYDDVYIIATPPAGKTDATTGTLTFTTEGGNPLTVNLSTPTITCPQYTLTFNDRGTKTTAQYYAGVVVEEPEEPTGVCTEPINYVFDGWATATVAGGSTTYEKVSFGSYTMPKQNTTLYAVYRYVEEGGGGSGELEKVTDIAQVTTDATYAIISFDEAYYLPNTQATSNPSTGSIAKEDGVITVVDAMKWNVSIAGNKFVFTSVADANNILWGAAANDGIRINETSTKQNPTKEWSLETVNDYGLVLFHTADNAAHKYLSTYGVADWRNYYSTNLNATNRAANLYKLSTGTTYYTSSPVCGPHLEVTDGKEIYVTGGNAGGTRDLVIAQQKVSYKATRLNVGPTSQVPDVKVATNGITVGGVVTSDVKVTIDQNKEQQTDGTYTITGTITVQYQPTANGKQEDIQVQLAVDYNAEARDNFTVHARSLPEEFVIVAKSGDKWYALNGDMSDSKAQPANGQVTLDDAANPTKATYAPCNAVYTFDGMPNTGDRTYVRFQGTDGAWLWASTGDNTGIQNNVLAQNPTGDANPYNWKLTTTDNVTYQFSNANNNRNLRLSGGNFGMYTSGVQDIRILPVEAKCIYNYAPTNLKVSVLKGTSATLTWDEVSGATKYQYSTDATNWTDAGSEPTVTINGLTETTEYVYYIRAYHEEVGVSQECIDYATVTFTTAACDDVPTNITYSADLNSITVSWTAAASNATIKYNTKEDGTGGGGVINNATSPCRISGGLNPNTTYYIQILAGGTCASPIIQVKTEDVKMDIVEWQPQGIVVDINTNEEVKVTLENEVSFGSGTGTVAEDLFFSKYFEATGNVKLLALYNGTNADIDLTQYSIKLSDIGKDKTGADYTEVAYSHELKLSIGIPEDRRTLKAGQELIMISYANDGTDDKVQITNPDGTTSYVGPNDYKVLACAAENKGESGWDKYVRVTSPALNFSGNDVIALFKNDDIIDVIGAGNKSKGNMSGVVASSTNSTFMDAAGWYNTNGYKITLDNEIGATKDYALSTNRCLLIRRNEVVSGTKAVTKNTTNFVTLGGENCEWMGYQIPDTDGACKGFMYVGKYDYANYYTKYVSMGDEQVFEANVRNEDGTLTIPITDLNKQSCRNIKITIKIKDVSDKDLKTQTYKVPIMITSDQTTAGQAFLALQENLATVEIDGSGNPTGNKTNLKLDEVREICKTCDVVVRDNATLSKAADDNKNDHPQVNNVYIYEGASLVVPDGNYTYNVNGLSLRRREDQVASLSVQGGEELQVSAESIYLDVRVNAENWHWFTLPYNCDIEDVTWVDGTPAKYGVDWFLSTYDGEKRAATQNVGCWTEYHGTTIEKGKGYILGVMGNLEKPKYTFELRFPMSKEVLASDNENKEVPVNAWGVGAGVTDDNGQPMRPNHKGWNLVGNPYLDYYQKNQVNSFGGLRLGELIGPDPETGYWTQSGTVPYVVVPVEFGWVSYDQVLVSETDLLPFTSYFMQVGNDDTHTKGQALMVQFASDNRGRASIARRAPSSVSEQDEPVIVGVSLTNAKGESDKTSLVIDNKYTDDYEMNADFFKWFGDYYRYYTKPVLYTIGADKQQRAFNAINEEQAAQPISMGTYTAQNGEYTFSLDRRSDLSRVKEVWLHDATESAYINLMQEDYSFSTGKTDGTGRFTLAVTLHPKSPTDITEGRDGHSYVTSHQRTLYVNNLPQQARVWVYDAVGKLLVNETTNVYQRAYHLGQAGVYFVRVKSQQGTETLQAVVE